jgi:hypothetical protein
LRKKRRRGNNERYAPIHHWRTLPDGFSVHVGSGSFMGNEGSMMNPLFFAIILYITPMILLLLGVHFATKKDVALYRNPATKDKVSNTIPVIISDEDLYKMFRKQNLWEFKLILCGYIMASITGSALWYLAGL